jgi:hypothetical protein
VAYERITKVVSEEEERPITVTSAFIYKFGAVLLAESLPSENEPSRYSNLNRLMQEPWEPSSNMLEEVQDALDAHPNVFDLKQIDPSQPLSAYGTRTGMLVDGPLFTMEVRLPKRSQHFEDGDVFEHFNVICDGSYFGAFASIDDIPVSAYIAHEFRELMRIQIEKATRYKAPRFGPCPIWTDIIVVFTDSMDSPSVPIVRSHLHQRKIYLVIDGRNWGREFAQWLFHLSLSYWRGFYQLSLQRLELVELDEEIQRRFVDAWQSVAAMSTTAGWKLWATSKLATCAALEIGQIHNLLMRYDECCWSYDNQRRDYLKLSYEVPHLSKVYRNMQGYTRRDFRPPSSIGAALEFLEKQVEVAKNIRSLILASLLGAVVGAIVTGLLSSVGHK